MASDYVVRYDAESDVLYVRRADVSIRLSRESRSDACLVLNFSDAGDRVGLQWIEPCRARWAALASREALPAALRAAVDEWWKGREPP
jgi:hypothetical protein